MSALSQDDLASACRRIYDLAGADFILPANIHAAGHCGRPGRIHIFPVAAGDVHFRVELDEARAYAGVTGMLGLPVRFEICLRRPSGRMMEIGGAARRELIRAFLLGAHAPIQTDLAANEPRYRISLQLGARFRLPCGELPAHERADPADVCTAVGRILYMRSRALFASEADGVTIWSGKAAQDLFGQSRPCPADLWPNVADAEFSSTEARLRPARRRFAMAAAAAGVAIALAGLLGVSERPPKSPPATQVSRAVDIGPVVMRAVFVPPSEQPETTPTVSPNPIVEPVGRVDPSLEEPAPAAAQQSVRFEENAPAAPPPAIETARGAISPPLVESSRVTTAQATAPRPVPRPQSIARKQTPAQTGHRAQSRNPLEFAQQAVASLSIALRKAKPATYQVSSFGQRRPGI